MPIPKTAREPLVIPLAALKETSLKDFTVKVRVPTPFERDIFDSVLVGEGVVYYDPQQIRDLTLAGAAALRGSEAFDDNQALLMENWQAGDAQKKANASQAMMFLELSEKNKTARKKLTADEIIAKIEEIKPDVIMDPVRRGEAVALQNEIMGHYDPLRKAFEDLTKADTLRSWIQVETYVSGWTGLEHEPDGNGRGGLERFEAEYLRDNIGAEAWEELNRFIAALHNIDKETEKNLDSLLEKQHDPIGSTAPASKEPTGSESGNSSEIASTATPAGESPMSTAGSSPSTKRTATKRGRSRSTPMAADGATSP